MGRAGREGRYPSLSVENPSVLSRGPGRAAQPRWSLPVILRLAAQYAIMSSFAAQHANLGLRLMQSIYYVYKCVLQYMIVLWFV